MNCANCHKPLHRDQAVVEHIVPLSRGGKNIETNLVSVHARCHRRKLSLWQRFWRWVGKWQWKLTMWLDSWQFCHKESLGYTCRHRILPNGKKECGE